MARLNKEQMILLSLIIILCLLGGGFLLWQKLNQKAIITNITATDSADITREIQVEDQLSQKSAEKKSTQTLTDQKIVTKKLKKIIVHVAGEVNFPGVYQLSEDDRVYDAVRAAGGETISADLDSLNLADFIYDGEKIYIPAENEPADKFPVNNSLNNPGKGEENLGNGKINLNQADRLKLEEIRGIGPSKASSIIEYRDKIGGFSDINQLLDVSGIGEKTLEKIRNDIIVR